MKLLWGLSSFLHDDNFLKLAMSPNYKNLLQKIEKLTEKMFYQENSLTLYLYNF